MTVTIERSGDLNKLSATASGTRNAMVDARHLSPKPGQPADPSTLVDVSMLAAAARGGEQVE